jgi:hypothetical protein
MPTWRSPLALLVVLAPVMPATAAGPVDATGTHVWWIQKSPRGNTIMASPCRTTPRRAG